MKHISSLESVLHTKLLVLYSRTKSQGYFTVMIPKNFIIFGILLMRIITVTGAGLVNDTCHNVWIKEDITKKAAKVVCNETAKVHDPKSQKGSYLMEDTGNWEGEIYACLCSCQLPFELQNGQIWSKNIILHGEILNYSCSDGYTSNIDKNITCHDGLLMTVPDSLDDKHINVSFRLKSLRDSFASGEVYHLCINETANSSFPEAEIRKKQKIFECLPENEMKLWYSLFNGSNYMLGYVNLTMKQKLQCMKTNGPPASSDQGKSGQLSDVYITGITVGIVAGIAIVIAVIVGSCILKKRNKKEKNGRKQDKEKSLNELTEQIPFSVEISSPAEEDI